MKTLIIVDFNTNSFINSFNRLFRRNCDICSRNDVVWIFYVIKFCNVFISPWILILSISNIPQSITPFDFVVNIFRFFRGHRRLLRHYYSACSTTTICSSWACGAIGSAISGSGSIWGWSSTVISVFMSNFGIDKESIIMVYLVKFHIL